MRSEPTAHQFSGPWHVMRQNDGYKVESYYWEENAIAAAKWLTRVEPNNSYYVEKLEEES